MLQNSSLHGDPAAALLEVLDPEQNHSFTDQYPFPDLSSTNVICTPTVPMGTADRLGKQILLISATTHQTFDLHLRRKRTDGWMNATKHIIFLVH